MPDCHLDGLPDQGVSPKQDQVWRMDLKALDTFLIIKDQYSHLVFPNKVWAQLVIGVARK